MNWAHPGYWPTWSVSRADVERIQVELYGSLGATGKGHGTDKAVILGLQGELPDSVDVNAIPSRLEQVRTSGQLRLPCAKTLAFDGQADLVFNKQEALPYHPNGLVFRALGRGGRVLDERARASLYHRCAVARALHGARALHQPGDAAE
jgi:L-serine dehydratase